MLTVSSYEAKTNLAALLRRAEAGETITITRRGVEIADLIPRLKPKMSVEEAVNRLRARRVVKKGRRRKNISRSELHIGHKY